MIDDNQSSSSLETYWFGYLSFVWIRETESQSLAHDDETEFVISFTFLTGSDIVQEVWMYMITRMLYSQKLMLYRRRSGDALSTYY